MNTAFLLAALHNGKPVIPVDDVVREHFAPLTTKKFLEYVAAGKIALPLVRMFDDAKSAKGVSLVALAAYLDERMAVAAKECRQLNRAA
jgi:hypothetical protein